MNDDAFGCLLLVLGGLIVWFGWPVSFWLILALILTAVLQHKARLHRDFKSFLGRVWQAATSALRDSAVGVSIGLGIVALAQAFFNALDASSTTVSRWEVTVASTQHRFAAALSPKIIFPVLLGAFLISLVWPHFRAVNRFSSAKKWGSRISTVLTTIAAFTFFTSIAVLRSEVRWVAARQPQARSAMKSIEEDRRQLLALCWVEQKFKIIGGPLRNELINFFATLPKTDDPNGAEQRAADWFASQAPSVKDTHAVAQPEMYDRIGKWLDGKGGPPSLEDVENVSNEARKVKEALPEAQRSAEEALKMAVGTYLPQSANPFVKEFVKSLAGALVKTVLADFPVYGISDHNAGTKAVRKKGSNGRSMLRMWRWSFPAKPSEAVSDPRDLAANARVPYVGGEEFARALGGVPSTSSGSSGSSFSSAWVNPLRGGSSYGPLPSSDYDFGPHNIRTGPIGAPVGVPVGRGVVVR